MTLIYNLVAYDIHTSYYIHCEMGRDIGGGGGGGGVTICEVRMVTYQLKQLQQQMQPLD